MLCMGSCLLLLLFPVFTSCNFPELDEIEQSPTSSHCNLIQIHTGRKVDSEQSYEISDATAIYDFPGSSSHHTQPSQDGKADSFSVYTRIIEAELPYLDSFVWYYWSLGVKSFYMLSNQAGSHSLLLERISNISRFGPRIVLLFREGPADSQLHQKKLFHKITEDFVIGVDIDEFWLLPSKFASLSDMVMHQPSDVYMASWQIAPNDKLTTRLSPPYHTYATRRGGKWMARKAVLKRIGIHDPEVYAGTSMVHDEGGTILHMVSRSFWDTIAKTAGQNLRGVGHGAYHGCEGADEMKRLLSEGALPWRLKQLAFHTNVPKALKVGSLSLRPYNHSLEKIVTSTLLSATVSETVDLVGRYYKIYKTYKQCLGRVMKAHPRNWNEMKEQAVDEFLHGVGCNKRDPVA